jgi:hypothetical protein
MRHEGTWGSEEMAHLILNFSIRLKCVGFTTPAALLPEKKSSRYPLDESPEEVRTMFYYGRESKHDSWAVQSVVKQLKESATMDSTVLFSPHFK